MKKTNVFLPALCMAALFCSCSGGSDSGDDLLASPLKVIENIDIDLTSESLSRSAQVARTVSPSDEGGAASPVMALSAPGVRLMAANGEIAVLAEKEKDPWTDPDFACQTRRGRGEVSATVSILSIVKDEIAAEVRRRNLPFGQAMSNLSIEAKEREIEKEMVNVTENYFRADLVGAVAYLYSYGKTDKADYNFVLKCIPNIMGLSLDTELYMELTSGGEVVERRYSRITSYRNQKERLEYGEQTSDERDMEDFWEQFTVTPSIGTAYKYNKNKSSEEEERATLLVSGNSVAAAYHSGSGGKLVDGTTGIMQGECSNLTTGGNWIDKSGGSVPCPSALLPSALNATKEKHPYKTSTPPSVSSIPSDLTSRLTSR